MLDELMNQAPRCLRQFGGVIATAVPLRQQTHKATLVQPLRLPIFVEPSTDGSPGR
jgi:hypothetical protein